MVEMASSSHETSHGGEEEEEESGGEVHFLFRQEFSVCLVSFIFTPEQLVFYYDLGKSIGRPWIISP